MAFMFENLQVYQKAVDFADRTSSFTERFSRGYRFIADRMNRASLSISANIAEGNGRFTKADRKNFFILKLTEFLLTSVTVTNYGAVPTLSERIFC